PSPGRPRPGRSRPWPCSPPAPNGPKAPSRVCPPRASRGHEALRPGRKRPRWWRENVVAKFWCASGSPPNRSSDAGCSYSRVRCRTVAAPAKAELTLHSSGWLAGIVGWVDRTESHRDRLGRALLDPPLRQTYPARRSEGPAPCIVLCAVLMSATCENAWGKLDRKSTRL